MFSSRLLVWILVALALLFIVTQITVPAIRGTKLFPLFRRSERKLGEQMLDWNQHMREEQMRTELAELMHNAPHAAMRYETDFQELMRKHQAGELTDAQLQTEWNRIYFPKLTPRAQAQARTRRYERGSPHN